MRLLNKIKNKIKYKLMKVKNILIKSDVYYIIEEADWVIKQEGKNIVENLNFLKGTISVYNDKIKDSIIHFGSPSTFFKNGNYEKPHSSNKIVLTWFHINEDDKNIKYIKEVDSMIAFWHTACSKTKEELIKYGATPEKIVLIPLGINEKRFYPISEKDKKEMRRKLGIPNNKIVIGSFQKDGNGWGEGMEPKLIKGPDILCDVIEELKKNNDVFVLLTGPARGYVKNRLNSMNIMYKHDFLKKPDDVSDYYKVIDLYIVTSRIEGGPRAIVEAIASGIPLITTKVGMAEDIITDGENGFLAEVGNVKEIVEKVNILINNSEIKNKIIENGLKEAERFVLKKLALDYEEKIYKKCK